ncbi:LPS O-antigen chain length determinant protein WzzB [Legionella brunensis]|uniref:Chain length determinant protein n=1 Tax=Legionella brunensis TaxID=29422 RepID=A0A0W0SE74_9GAMM|nr:Wzz/FepE/Etk N-terminal domain-containing protein [Legionella brunensis]KTC81441.1 Chain length determinant protein [Legionella brunensis]
MEGKNSTVMHYDEIDLAELLRTLWKRKFLILFITFLCALAGASYIFVRKPIYEAKAYISLPSLADIAAFNYGRTGEDSRMKPFRPAEIYQIFTDNLLSESIKRKFFKVFFLSSLSEVKRNTSQDKLYDSFSKQIAIKELSKLPPSKYLLTVKGTNPAQTVIWAKDYIALVSQKTASDIMLIIQNQKEAVTEDLEKQIAMKREVASKKRSDRLTQLREALTVAQAIGIKEPSISSLNGTITDASTFNEPSMMYLRGSKALEVEIKNLTLRQSDDAFIPDLRTLESDYHFYKTIKIDSEDATVFRLDGAIRVPDLPVSLQASVLILLSIVFGLLLGVSWVTLQHFWLKK